MTIEEEFERWWDVDPSRDISVSPKNIACEAYLAATKAAHCVTPEDRATIKRAAKFIKAMAQQIFDSGTDINGKFEDDYYGSTDKADYERRKKLADELSAIAARKP